jgi:hypothetical protein
VAEHLAYPLVAGSTYEVMVGNGGTSFYIGNTGGDGINGDESRFGNEFIAYGGGGGGGATNGGGPGGVGGSSGGSGNGDKAVATKGVVPEDGDTYGSEGAARQRNLSNGYDGLPQGGGGAGGPGIGSQGGPGIVRDITGDPVTYAAGGGNNLPVQGQDGIAGTGNGGYGAQGNGNRSKTGGSGIVIVRFPAKTP